MDTIALLQPIVQVFDHILSNNLVGVYLHGSLAMGCHNPKRSDIDLLVVARIPLTSEEKKLIAKQLLAIHDELPGEGGIELSVILESSIRSFEYPTTFEFHYSNVHRERYRSDENYVCGGFADSDLAAHLTVTYHRGIALFGQPYKDLFPPVERVYYIQSIMGDVEGAAIFIADNPVYYALNLCRVLLYLREGTVASKREGGEWGLRAFPQFERILSPCLNEYNGDTARAGQVPDSEELVRFAEYMLKEIHWSQ